MSSIILKKVNPRVSASVTSHLRQSMASTDEGELSPSAMEVKEGQRKVDLAKALKSRVYGQIKQARPDETTFRQAVRDMMGAMDEVQKDNTGSVEEATKQILKQQVDKAKEKALDRLMEVNPSLSSLDQVVDIRGNPPSQEQVPLASVPPGLENSARSEDASGFETVGGTGTEEPTPPTSRVINVRDKRKGTVEGKQEARQQQEPTPGTSRAGENSNGIVQTQPSHQEGTSTTRRKKNKGAKGDRRNGINGAGEQAAMGPEPEEALERELRKAEETARQLREQWETRRHQRGRTAASGISRQFNTRPSGAVWENGVYESTRDRVANPRYPTSPQEYAPSVGSSSKPRKGKKRKQANNTGVQNGQASSTPSSEKSKEAPFFARNGVRRLAEETTGHWGDLDDSEGEATEHIDWKARATMRSSLAGVNFPKGWEVPPPHVVRKFFRQIDFNKELKKGTLKPFLGTLGDFPRFKAMFYENIHVQDASVLSKCEALDSLLPDPLIEKMFFGLSVSAVDYVTRLERLIRRFDREDVYRDNLLRQLDRLQSSRGENEEVLERAVYAIKSFMDNSSHHEKSSRWLLDTLEDHLPETMLRQYNFDLRMNQYKHTASRLTQWLELYLESLMDTRQMKRMVGERRGKHRNHGENHWERTQASWENGEAAEEVKFLTTHVEAKHTPDLCEYCAKGHDIYHCAQFFALTAGGRRQALDKFQGCYLCLKKGHFINDCSSKLKCRFCGGKHNSSIHLTPAPEPSTQEGTSFSGEEEVRKKVSGAQDAKGVPKLPMEKLSGLTRGEKRERTMERVPKNDGELAAERLAQDDNIRLEKAELQKLIQAENSLATLAVAIGPNRIKVNALLDTGADNASLDTEVAARCGFQPLETQTYSVKVGGGRINTYTDVGLGFTTVNKLDSSYQARCVVRVYPTPVGHLLPVDWSKKKLDFPHLKDLPIEPVDPEAPVSLLIGTRNPQLFEMLDVRRGGPDEPWAFLSPLGWVVIGPVPAKEPSNAMINVGHTFAGKQEKEPNELTFDQKTAYLGLKRQVERLWNHEREMETAQLRNMSSNALKTVAQGGS